MIIFNCTFNSQASKEFCPRERINIETWQFLGLVFLSFWLICASCNLCYKCLDEFTQTLLSSPTLEEIPQNNFPVIEIVQDPFIAILQNLHNGVLQNSHQLSRSEERRVGK